MTAVHLHALPTPGGRFLGRVVEGDALHPLLARAVGARPGETAFRAYRLRGLHEVHRYDEEHTAARVIVKFYGPRFGDDAGLAALVTQQEFDNLNILRGYGLVGAPHHVVRPLGTAHVAGEPALALEYFPGEELTASIERALRGRPEELQHRLLLLAGYLAGQHNRTAIRLPVDFAVDADYLGAVVERLRRHGRVGAWDVDELLFLREVWRERPRMWQDRQVWLHGDATPRNFLFDRAGTVAAIDLERMRRGDRAFDVGRVAGELQHAFLEHAGRSSTAEPFVSRFLHAYCSHFPDRDSALRAVTARTPFHMGVTLLRIARNDFLSDDYARRLVKQAKRLLRAP